MKASIDIGTNTVLLLIAEKDDLGGLRVIREEQRVPRLGRGVDTDRTLHPGSMARVIEALREYKGMIEAASSRYGAGDVSPVVTATSAVRDAANRDEFMKMVYEATGWKIRLLSGDDEANATFRGAVRSLPATLVSKYDDAIVLDIGGGSTETAFGSIKPTDEGDSEKETSASASTSELKPPSDYRSVDAGCVRFTERWLRDPENTGDTNPEGSYIPSQEQVDACRKDAFKELEQINHIRTAVEVKRVRGRKPVAIGVAGTVTSLAYMHLGLSGPFSSEVINGTVLSRKDISKWLEYASANSPGQMTKDWPEVMSGRADIVLAGLIILDAFMEFMSLDEMVVSTGGIRHGVL